MEQHLHKSKPTEMAQSSDLSLRSVLNEFPKNKLGGGGGLYDPKEFLLDTCQPVIKKDGAWFSLTADGLTPCARSVGRQQEALARYRETIPHQPLPPIFLDGQKLSYAEAAHEIAERLPLLDNACRAVMTIPVYNEANLIGRFLDTVKRQEGLQSGTLEVSFIVNGPKGYNKDTTSKLIAEAVPEFQARGINLTSIDVEFPIETANVGLARRLQHDVMLLRSLKRSDSINPLYFILEDGDTYQMEPGWVRNVIDHLDRNPHLDAIKGLVDRNPSILAQNDLLLLERRITMLTEQQYFRRCMLQRQPLVPYGENLTPSQAWLRPFTQGCGGAISAEALALIRGGFDPIDKLEDIKLGWKLSVLRGIPTEQGILLNTDTIQTVGYRSQSSPRRFVQAIAEMAHGDQSYVTPYKEFGLPQKTLALRSLDMSALLTQPQVAKLAEFSAMPTEEVQFHVNRILHFFKDVICHVVPETAENSAQDNLRRYASFLSSYLVGRSDSITWDGERLTLHDPTTLAETMARYRERLAKRAFRFQKCEPN
jgi:hypothetical protein